MDAYIAIPHLIIAIVYGRNNSVSLFLWSRQNLIQELTAAVVRKRCVLVPRVPRVAFASATILDHILFAAGLKSR